MSGYGTGAPGADDPGAPLFMSGPAQTYPPVTGTVPVFPHLRAGTTPKSRQSDG